MVTSKAPAFSYSATHVLDMPVETLSLRLNGYVPIVRNLNIHKGFAEQLHISPKLAEELTFWDNVHKLELCMDDTKRTGDYREKMG